MAINVFGISHLFALDNGNYLIFTGSIEQTTIALMNCVIHLGQLLDEKMKAERKLRAIEWRLVRPNRSFVAAYLYTQNKKEREEDRGQVAVSRHPA